MTKVSDEYSSYFAEFYDLLHRGTPEVPFIERLAAEHGRRILELGCGTGRLLIPLAEKGMNVVGLDSSEDMLAICRAKLAGADEAARSRVELIHADMARMGTGGDFDIVLLMCSTFLHATSADAQVRLLRRARSRLRPGGVCVLDINTPSLEGMIQGHDRWETFVFYDPNRDWMVIDRFRPRFDLRRQIEQDDIRLVCVRKGVAEARMSTRTRLAVVFPREVFHAVRRAGFVIRSAHSDHDGRAWRSTTEAGTLVLVLAAEG